MREEALLKEFELTGRNPIYFFKALTPNIKHSGSTFYDHCYRVYTSLQKMKRDKFVCLAGLYHSIYGTEWFDPQFKISRSAIKKVIGDKAENLVHILCTTPDRDKYFLKNAKKKKNLFAICYANLMDQEDIMMQDKDNSELMKKYHLKYKKVI